MFIFPVYSQIGNLHVGLEAIDGCDDATTTTTTMVPWDDDDFSGNITQEACMFMSYELGSCKPDKHSVSVTREYYGICPFKCGEDWILRTGTFGARKCGHVCCLLYKCTPRFLYTHCTRSEGDRSDFFSRATVPFDNIYFQDGILPDEIGWHTMMVLPCEYGQFRVDDGVAEKSVFLAMLVGIIAFMNI